MSFLLKLRLSFIGLSLSATALSQELSQLHDTQSLEFQSFFQSPIGPGGLVINDKVKQTNGKKVRIMGYMVKSEIPTQGTFILTPRPIQTSEHADGNANDLPAALCRVYLDPSQKDWLVLHSPGLISLEGIFSFNRVEDPDGTVAWFHLQLAPEAISIFNSKKHTSLSTSPSSY